MGFNSGFKGLKVFFCDCSRYECYLVSFN